jgi:pyruvate/2-oxoglutarate dehydrogenase complex dihydrolipoamide acyltransferase (E2) component
MADVTLVRVPDIGDFEDVEVIEVLVGPGDRVEVDDSLVSIESDKATMEIPSPVAGVVAAVHVSLGDRVSEGAFGAGGPWVDGSSGRGRASRSESARRVGGAHANDPLAFAPRVAGRHDECGPEWPRRRGGARRSDAR